MPKLWLVAASCWFSLALILCRREDSCSAINHQARGSCRRGRNITLLWLCSIGSLYMISEPRTSVCSTNSHRSSSICVTTY
jgi:hypothetical protein